VAAFLRDYWWQMGLGLLAVGGWAARVEAAIAHMDRLATDHEIVTGLGRLQCLRDRTTATAAGIPCRILLDGAFQ
jgi:hypothetical protein